MSIEQRIMDNLMSEAVNYNDNGQISADLAEGMREISLSYIGYLITPNGQLTTLNLRVDLNDDDIEAVESDNVVYVYLNLDKVVVTVESMVEVPGLLNKSVILHSATKFQPRNQKCWKDDHKLYLLKMNRNSGIIGRFDLSTTTFKKQDTNYNSSDDEYIGRELLTKDYLQDYFSHELSQLYSPISPMFGLDLDNKFDHEVEHRFISPR